MAGEERIIGPEDDPLKPPVTGHEFEIRAEERQVVFAGLGIHQMNWGDIAFAAFCRREPARAPDIQHLGGEPFCLEALQQRAQTDAVASDDHQIRQA